MLCIQLSVPSSTRLRIAVVARSHTALFDKPCSYDVVQYVLRFWCVTPGPLYRAGKLIMIGTLATPANHATCGCLRFEVSCILRGLVFFSLRKSQRTETIAARTRIVYTAEPLRMTLYLGS